MWYVKWIDALVNSVYPDQITPVERSYLGLHYLLADLFKYSG